MDAGSKEAYASKSYGRFLVDGVAASDVVFSDTPISFMMGVDAKTGQVIDRHHPLKGAFLKNKIVTLPCGRGSCSASGVLLELLIEDAAPAALIFRTKEDILTLGVLVARTMFGKSIPVVLLNDVETFSRLNGAKNVRIASNGLHIDDNFYMLSSASESQLMLTETDRELLSGKNCSLATKMAMEIIVAFSAIQNAPNLIDVSQVHIDACIYAGKSSLLVPEKLHALGGRVAVPSTCNALNVDKQRWQQLGADPEISIIASKIGDVYLAMGAIMSFTCAPYLLKTKPKQGEQIGWGESNAVVFANSVLGARTQKYPDYLDVMIALTGRAPYYGCHSTEGRYPEMSIMIPKFDEWDDSLFPVLGYYIGEIAGSRIPLIYGLEDSHATIPDLKAFSAAFATTSSAAMFHMKGITPEAEWFEIDNNLDHVAVSIAEIQRAWRELNTASANSVDLVALGNPHFALEEFEELARLCKGREKKSDVDVFITTGRYIYGEAAKMGYLDIVEAFGGRLITDTCWCAIEEPVLPVHAQTIMTNSAKYAHYGPGMTRKDYHFGSLAGCVDAACTGTRSKSDLSPSWLFGAKHET